MRGVRLVPGKVNERRAPPAHRHLLGVLSSGADSFDRHMPLHLAASPCALTLGTPSAVLAGIVQVARHGVLIPSDDAGDFRDIALTRRDEGRFIGRTAVILEPAR